jgi:hypothetical protein
MNNKMFRFYTVANTTINVAVEDKDFDRMVKALDKCTTWKYKDLWIVMANVVLIQIGELVEKPKEGTPENPELVPASN